MLENKGLFRCPLCHTKIETTNNGLVCQQNHHFDLSKKGTLYFLSHAVKTEYDQGMFEPRRRMIQSGMYQPVLELLAQELPQRGRCVRCWMWRGKLFVRSRPAASS